MSAEILTPHTFQQGVAVDAVGGRVPGDSACTSRPGVGTVVAQRNSGDPVGGLMAPVEELSRNLAFVASNKPWTKSWS